MFSKIFYYFILIFLVAGNSQAFSSLSCEEVFSFTEIARVVRVNPLRKNHRHSTKSYRQFLINLAQFSLGVDSLSPQQVEALETYYDVVRGEEGEDGTFTRVGNYTFPQKRRIVRFLREVFSLEQVTTLIENGVVEVSRIDPKIGKRKVLKSLREGKPIFVRNQIRTSLGHYVNLDKMKVTKMMAETEYGLLVEVEKLDNKPGKLIRGSIYLLDNDRLLNSPEIETVFSAIRSTRKKIKNSDINFLPSINNKEVQLAKQGFETTYTAGIDKLNEWVAVRRALQDLNANPYKTHIEYFADQVFDYIEHIRQGIKNEYSHRSKKLTQQLKLLVRLKGEAQKAISDEKVTYKWWLEFNVKLTEVMSGEAEEVNFLVNLALDVFPLGIIMPTIKEDLGIMTFNRAMIEGVHPASVMSKNDIYVDGVLYSSGGFFLHDLDHSLNGSNQAYLGYSMGVRLFHKRLLSNIENLPPEKRKEAENIYFLMTHERVRHTVQQGSREVVTDVKIANLTPKEMRRYVIQSICVEVV